MAYVAHISIQFKCIQSSVWKFGNGKVLPALLAVITTIAFSPPMGWDIDQYSMYSCYYTQNVMVYSTDNKLRQGCIYVSFLSLTDEGKNIFEVAYASNNFLVTHDINVDEHGKKTVMTGLFGSYDILLITRTRSCSISILTIFINKIIVWWQYPLLSLQDLGLFVHGIKESGK